MALKKTEDILRDIVVEQLGVDASQVTRRARFDQDLNVDSLDVIEITMAAEEEFNIEIRDEEFEGADTFGKLVDLVDKKAAAAPRRTKAG